MFAGWWECDRVPVVDVRTPPTPPEPARPPYSPPRTASGTTPPQPPPEIVFAADYILLTYEFNDGRDLDTRTRVVHPDIGQAAASDHYIGWFQEEKWPLNDTPIEQWGGDNTGTGFEAVLVDLVELRQRYPSETTLAIDCRGVWYQEAGQRPVKVVATLFRGGVMVRERNRFTFSNPTATSTATLGSHEKPVTAKFVPRPNSHDPEKHDGERIAIFRYDLNSNRGEFDGSDLETP